MTKERLIQYYEKNLENLNKNIEDILIDLSTENYAPKVQELGYILARLKNRQLHLVTFIDDLKSLDN